MYSTQTAQNATIWKIEYRKPVTEDQFWIWTAVRAFPMLSSVLNDSESFDADSIYFLSNGFSLPMEKHKFELF